MLSIAAPHRRAAAVAFGALIGSLMIGVAPTNAAPARTLTVSTTRPIAGETVTVSANLPGSSAREVRLQVKVARTWRTVKRRTSDRAVRARFAYRVTSHATTRLRVVAPAARYRGERLPKRTSRVVTLRTTPQSVRLGLPPTTPGGTDFRAVVVASPARTGRPVAIQRRSGADWATVATVRQNSTGQAVATLRTSTTATYRAVVSARAGAARVVSPVTRIDVETTPVTPTPEVPRERCALPTGGTVTWGRGAGLTPLPGVAKVEITTDDGLAVTSKDVYSHASMRITDGDGAEQTIGTRLRLRGNSTSWVSMKYPYKVKLDASSSLLSMPASKDWVLLANFYDRSLLRGDAAFEAARRLGMPWVPRMRPAEVWLNGTYYGLYQLGEGIETSSSRVDLPSGGALLEADRWPDSDPVFTTPQGLQVFVKSTTDAAAVDVARTRVDRAEDVLYSDDFADTDGGYRTCLDVPSFVDAYLLAELTKSIDAGFNNSVWMVLGGDGRVAMGPAWDFDQSAGNRTSCQLDDPTGWFIARHWFDTTDEQNQTCRPSQLGGPDGHWYQRLLADPAFVTLVRQRWGHVRDALAELPDYVDDQAAEVGAAATRTFTPRADGGAGIPLEPTFLEGPDHVFHDSWSAEAQALSDWYAARIAWLDEQLAP